MLHRRYLAAAIASVMTVTGLFASVPAAAKPYLQCVPFARAESGVEICGNAKTWWSQAAGTYARGEEPRTGADMAFAGTRGMPMGPVAVVQKLVYGKRRGEGKRGAGRVGLGRRGILKNKKTNN